MCYNDLVRSDWSSLDQSDSNSSAQAGAVGSLAHRSNRTQKKIWQRFNQLLPCRTIVVHERYWRKGVAKTLVEKQGTYKIFLVVPWYYTSFTMGCCTLVPTLHVSLYFFNKRITDPELYKRYSSRKNSNSSARKCFQANDSEFRGYFTRPTRWLSRFKTPSWRWTISFKLTQSLHVYSKTIVGIIVRHGREQWYRTFRYHCSYHVRFGCTFSHSCL